MDIGFWGIHSGHGIVGVVGREEEQEGEGWRGGGSWEVGSVSLLVSLVRLQGGTFITDQTGFLVFLQAKKNTCLVLRRLDFDVGTADGSRLPFVFGGNCSAYYWYVNFERQSGSLGVGGKQVLQL